MTHVLKVVTRSTGLLPASQGKEASQPTLAARVIGGLAGCGFTHAFGIPGRHVQGLFHELPGSGITPILARHEQGAVFMADGFARAGGAPAVVIGTAGPGAANMVTAVANAYADGTPVLCLTGAPPRHFACRGAFQELGDDHTGVTPAVFAPITRYNAQLSHASQLGPVMRLALTALQEGGPVNLSFPADMLERPAPELPPYRPLALALPPDPTALAEAAGWLDGTHDILILAGRGALGCDEALVALAERLQAPVITTIHGRGVINEDHPLALGPQGFGASHWAERWLATRRPSVVLAVGTSLREISTNVYDPVFQGTQALIHCTRDTHAVGRAYTPTVPVIADAGAFLAALLPLVPARTPNEDLAAFKAETPRYDDGALADGPGKVSPRRVTEAVRAALGPNDMLFVDTGNSAPWSVRYYPVRRRGTYFASMHLAAMGWGVAAAVGAQLARPNDRVVALVGDGCFQMAGMEVATAVQYGLPVVWVVLNDARLNMVYQGSKGRYGAAVPNTELSPVDCARVAEGLGARGFRVDDPARLDEVLAAALACGGPAVVDVAIDPDLAPPMAGRFEALRRYEEAASW
ncbi:MAG: thiamine pyrophosphate protein binding domain protein [Cyanobacteria bacterium RYN_339]|nr:thiamine pyrophosphate protein binding domain protein [Cyanobacteria bacterium RYN_339]